MSELQLFLEGSRVIGRIQLSPPIYEHKAFVVPAAP
jgi:hypothetical protein